MGPDTCRRIGAWRLNNLTVCIVFCGFRKLKSCITRDPDIDYARRQSGWAVDCSPPVMATLNKAFGR